MSDLDATYDTPNRIVRFLDGDEAVVDPVAGAGSFLTRIPTEAQPCDRAIGRPPAPWDAIDDPKNGVTK